jgi:ABC-type dipeptide/oligopeptide/nickel transport system ATPase component
MVSSDLFRFAITLSFQQARAKVRRNVVAFAGIAGGIVLVLVQLGFQSALYESDEPTASLDRMSGRMVIDRISEAVRTTHCGVSASPRDRRR